VKKIVVGLLVGLFLLTVGACSGPTAADRANENLSKAAENFEVPRRIVGVNAITDSVLFSVEGFCSYETYGNTYQAICKQPDGSIERTTLAKSDNVTIVVTQMQGVHVDLFRSRVIFRPETIIPNFDLSTSAQ
jgi:hypothetical protein